MSTFSVLTYDFECKPLRVQGIDVVLFKGRTDNIITSGATQRMLGEAAFGVNLRVPLRRPVRICIIIADPQYIYSGNTYVNLHGGIDARLDLVLLATPRGPGGGAGQASDLNPPDDGSGVQYTYRAIQQQPDWSELEKEAVTNLVGNFVTFVAHNKDSQSEDFKYVASNWKTALSRLGIDAERLLAAQQLVEGEVAVATATA